MALSTNGENVAVKGLDLDVGITYTDSTIKANEGFVVVPGDTVGKRQPNVSGWRTSVLLNYRLGDH